MYIHIYKHVYTHRCQCLGARACNRVSRGWGLHLKRKPERLRPQITPEEQEVPSRLQGLLWDLSYEQQRAIQLQVDVENPEGAQGPSKLRNRGKGAATKADTTAQNTAENGARLEIGHSALDLLDAIAAASHSCAHAAQ